LRSSLPEDAASTARAAAPPALADAIAAARSRLGRLASELHVFSVVSSTNDVAARCGEGAVIVADAQTAGRGRRGHAWFSPPGGGLYVSVVLVPSRAASDPGRATQLVTLAVGVALSEAIESTAGLRAGLKWPNDLYVGPRKLGGILAESSDDRVIVGYGINLRAAAYPDDLADRVTSIESELGRPVGREPLLIETLAAIATRYDDLIAGRFDAILDGWRGRAVGAVGRRVAWSTASGAFTGTTEGIDGLGALLVRVGDRVERIVSGEVTWL
jgi:BirA family transcriptional regulator, biotin operon repressor / biotin---[acetyl-CoA-carboxylase] ligase